MAELLAQVSNVFNNSLIVRSWKRPKISGWTLSKIFSNLISVYSQSGPCNHWSYNNIWERTHCWLLHALHEPWNQYSLQKTSKETSRSLLLPFASFTWRLDLHCHCISLSFYTSVHLCKVDIEVNRCERLNCPFVQIQPVWMGQSSSLYRGSWSAGQRVQSV